MINGQQWAPHLFQPYQWLIINDSLSINEALFARRQAARYCDPQQLAEPSSQILNHRSYIKGIKRLNILDG